MDNKLERKSSNELTNSIKENIIGGDEIMEKIIIENNNVKRSDVKWKAIK